MSIKHELPTIGDAVDALTNSFTKVTKFEYWHGNNKRTRTWTVRFPSLLAQLEAAKIPGMAYAEQEGARHGKRSASPAPARIDAINLELAITYWAADMVWRAHRPVREQTAANLRAIVGAYPEKDGDILHALWRWVGQARVVAHWQAPPWKPPAPCPLCGAEGSLRVHLSDKTAACVECRETWDETTIGLLAEHVRTTTREAALARVGIGGYDHSQ